MGYIHFEIVQAAAEGLLGQLSILNNIKEEIIRAEQILGQMDYMGDTLYCLKKSRREIDEQIRVLRESAGCLLEITQAFKETEQRISDVYNLETIQYERTRFDTSIISGLEPFEHMLVFR